MATPSDETRVPKSSSLETDNLELQSHQLCTQSHPFDKALGTRNLCALAVFIGWAVCICCIAIGIQMIVVEAPIDSYFIGRQLKIGVADYCFSPEPSNGGFMNLWAHRTYATPKLRGFTVFITLGFTTVITILLDSMCYVHSTWALAREGRLHKNSNLRLFSSSKDYLPNKWYMNVVSFMSLGIIYGALSSVNFDTSVYSYCGDTAKAHPTTPESHHDALDFSGWGFLGIGIGLLLQAFVCTVCLYSSSMVVTWSSNPLINAKAYFYSKLSSASPEDFNQRKLRPLSLGETLPSNTASDTLLVESAGVLSNGNPPPSVTIQSAPTPTPTPISDMSPECSVSCPQKRQTSMLTVFPEASRIRYIIWAYFGGFAIWSMVLGIVASTTHKFYREEIDPEADSAYKAWEYSAILYVPYLGAGKFTQRGDWAGYIVQILTQSSIVFGIHCVEIIVNMSRDESSWRKVASVGANMGDSPAKSFMTSWQCVILTLFKSIVQWVFDQAFSADFEVSMALYPLIAMTGLFLRLALFTECLVRRKPHGPQPVTYGDIQRLSKFIDDWDHKRLFWGDKGEVKDGIRRAGTAGSRLCELSPDAKYIGLT